MPGNPQRGIPIAARMDTGAKLSFERYTSAPAGARRTSSRIAANKLDENAPAPRSPLTTARDAVTVLSATRNVAPASTLRDELNVLISGSGKCLKDGATHRVRRSVCM